MIKVHFDPEIYELLKPILARKDMGLGIACRNGVERPTLPAFEDQSFAEVLINIFKDEVAAIAADER